MVSKNNNFNNALVWQRVCCAIVMLLSCSIGIKAQRATISDKTGHLVSAKTTTFNENSTNYEQGFDHGFSSMWKHNQLPLTITTTDQNRSDSTGLIKNHGNNMKFKEMNGKTIAQGREILIMPPLVKIITVILEMIGTLVRRVKTILKSLIEHVSQKDNALLRKLF